MGSSCPGVRATSEHGHHVAAFTVLVPGTTAFGQLIHKTGPHLGVRHAGLVTKAERSRRPDEVQGEEFVRVTDRFPRAAVSLVNALYFED